MAQLGAHATAAGGGGGGGLDLVDFELLAARSDLLDDRGLVLRGDWPVVEVERAIRIIRPPVGGVRLVVWNDEALGPTRRT